MMKNYSRTQRKIAAKRGVIAKALLAITTGIMLISPPAHAGIGSNLNRCAAISGDTARLICFDAVAANMNAEHSLAAKKATAALAQEFRFDSNVIQSPHFLRTEVSGNLRLSRETAAARKVEGLVRRITKAIGNIDGWSLAITVHGGKVTLSRGSPYTGTELLAQAKDGMTNSGLPKDRYSVMLGPDANPTLWDDGRVRSANEHIDIVVLDLGGDTTR
ncbi:MAG: hypothetical protein OSB67_09430 [Alphaproteobacteria bacterium]|nr:hypothetical protein [Alphaproteobacteria bacterium]